MGYSTRNGYLHYEYTEEDRRHNEALDNLTKKAGTVLKTVALVSAGSLLYYHAVLKPVWNYVQRDNIKSATIEQIVSPK